MSAGYPEGTILCRVDELKLGMVIVYASGLRKRIVKLDILGGEMFPGHTRYTFDDGGCASRAGGDFVTIEVLRDMSPPGEFRP